jgi:hypothetical protein
MTRDDVVREVMSRVRVPRGAESHAGECLNKWLALYPAHFRFGPSAVQAGARLLERELAKAPLPETQR